MLLIHLLAQAAASPQRSGPAEAAQQGGGQLSAGFFAAQNPNSAVDMVGRLPGFSLDTGASVRGFEGAAGNVLIDGQRPVVQDRRPRRRSCSASRPPRSSAST